MKEERIKVKREKTAVFLDGKEIELSNFDISRILGRPTLSLEGQKGLSDDDLKRIQVRKKLVVEEETSRHTKKIKAFIPVRQFGWEKRNLENESVHGMSLARELASNEKLVMRPQIFDFFTRQGERVTINFTNEENHRNTQRVLLMREDLLKQYLNKKKLALIWVIWGEREYSTKSTNGWGEGTRPAIPYKVYQTIKHYNSKAGVV
jgi:hypothetical protein